jgi:uncharacterized membrane protein
MRAVASWVLDRLVLVLAAACVLTAIVGLVALTDRNGLDDTWGMFIFQTIALPPIIVYRTSRILRQRHRRFYRRWPLVLVSIGSLLVHCAVLAFVIQRFHPQWKMPQWLVIDFVELLVIGIAVEIAFEYSTTNSPLWSTVRHQLKQLTGTR